MDKISRFGREALGSIPSKPIKKAYITEQFSLISGFDLGWD